MTLHHDVVGAIFLEIWGVACLAVSLRGSRFTFGDGALFVLGAGLLALSHLVA